MIVSLAAAAALIAQMHPGGVACIIGTSGTGKSRVAKMADATGAWGRRIVFDPHAKLDRDELARGEQLYPWEGHLCTFRELCENPYWLEEVDRLVVDPETLDPKEMGFRFSVVADMVWEQRGLTLVAEEVALYGYQAEPMLLRLGTGGRHCKVRLVLISQSLSIVSPKARRFVTHLVAFAQSDALDLDPLREKSPELARAVQQLRVGDPPRLWRQGGALESVA